MRCHVLDGGRDPSPHDIACAVGRELRSIREHRGWTRLDLATRLNSEITSQAVATYEQGSRHCTVARFVELCHTLGTPAPWVLGTALQRAEIDLLTLDILVDLRTLALDERAELGLLRRWANNLLHSDGDYNGVVELKPAVVEQMAALCDLTHAQLASMLAEFTPPLTA
ncbi:helix-turn-helix domain-containing protein [Actinokineospora diospyrosa]|uniref:helix-turn-helix domain-containing protein n=1 Tax=Actinokineospora diospyrosa TaxID=103728 RepID=UPI002646BA4D|nr:helix-turn-helix transcriptional regulator [Actinokineospora diospyrosa]